MSWTRDRPEGPLVKFSSSSPPSGLTVRMFKGPHPWRLGPAAAMAVTSGETYSGTEEASLKVPRGARFSFLSKLGSAQCPSPYPVSSLFSFLNGVHISQLDSTAKLIM